MVTILEALIMSVLQGIAEWLPISSEGQLSILFINFYKISELNAVTLALLLHLGTMIAVLVKFRSDFIVMATDWRLENPLTRITILATIGTAFTALPIVIFFKTYWEELSTNLPISTGSLFTIIIGLLLIFTGIILSKQSEQGIREYSSMTGTEAFALGLAQGIAALPGISRSGMTITVLLIIGLIHRDALKTSFIISVPAVLGATGLEFLLEGFSFTSTSIIIGTVQITFFIAVFSILLTAIVGYITMNLLLSFKDVSYDKFCIGLGILTILLSIVFIIIEII